MGVRVMMMIIIKIRNSLLKRIIQFSSSLARAKTLITANFVQPVGCFLKTHTHTKNNIIFLTPLEGNRYYT